VAGGSGLMMVSAVPLRSVMRLVKVLNIEYESNHFGHLSHNIFDLGQI
jgi:hypothetical protein